MNRHLTSTANPAGVLGRRLAVGAFGIGLLAAVPACGSSSGTTAGTSSAGSATPGMTIPTPVSGAAVDAATFALAMRAPGTIIVDVRTPAEYASGHLPSAINVDVDGADFAAKIASLAKDVPYAVYCHSGNRSAVAVSRMTADGFTHPYHLAGGITAWAAAGGSIVTG